MFVKIQMLFDFFEIGQILYIHQKSQNWTKFVLTFLTFIGLCLCFFSKRKPKTEKKSREKVCSKQNPFFRCFSKILVQETSKLRDKLEEFENPKSDVSFSQLLQRFLGNFFPIFRIWMVFFVLLKNISLIFMIM